MTTLEFIVGSCKVITFTGKDLRCVLDKNACSPLRIMKLGTK